MNLCRNTCKHARSTRICRCGRLSNSIVTWRFKSDPTPQEKINGRVCSSLIYLNGGAREYSPIKCLPINYQYQILLHDLQQTWRLTGSTSETNCIGHMETGRLILMRRVVPTLSLNWKSDPYFQKVLVMRRVMPNVSPSWKPCPCFRKGDPRPENEADSLPPKWKSDPYFQKGYH